MHVAVSFARLALPSVGIGTDAATVLLPVRPVTHQLTSMYKIEIHLSTNSS